tara:strand:- start:14571 stop:14969 length:399 start_codon:yes stop_codon:yes gene_type:complete
MRDEALIHFHLGRDISAGLLLPHNGGAAPGLVSEAAPWLDPRDPGRCAVGFCVAHPDLVGDIVGPPPATWQSWAFAEWDSWFGRINGVFLVDLQLMKVTQYPLYSCAPKIVRCDLSGLPRRLVAVEEWLETE